jgi:hypothetical protein
MSRINYIGIKIEIVTLIFYVVVYKYQCEKCYNLIRCYPTGEIFPLKDSNANIKYDSVYHTISNFKPINSLEVEKLKNDIKLLLSSSEK